MYIQNLIFHSQVTLNSIAEMIINPLKQLKLNGNDMFSLPRPKTILQVLDIVFPKDCSKLICEYDNGNHNELYNKVTRKLNLYSFNNRNVELNFYNRNFLENLYKLLPDKNKIDYHDFFYHDLSRFILKWMIYMKQDIESHENNISNMEKRNISRNVQQVINSILLVLDKRIPERIIQSIKFSNLSFKNSDSNNLEFLMNYEFLERPDVFDLFNSALDEFYRGLINCNELKEKYFHGNFNNDILLKGMIYFHDSMNEMKRCIQNLPLSPFSFLKMTSFSPSSPTFDSLEKMENDHKRRDEIGNGNQIGNNSIISKKSILNGKRIHERNIKFIHAKNIKIFNMDNVSNSILKYYLENNLKFEIKSFYAFYGLLRKLEDGNLLYGKNLQCIMTFHDGSDNDKCDSDSQFSELDKKKLTECLKLIKLLYNVPDGKFQIYLDMIK